MDKMTEKDFIRDFAKRWNKKLSGLTLGTDAVRHYPGWVNLEHMLKVFLRAYKIRSK